MLSRLVSQIGYLKFIGWILISMMIIQCSSASKGGIQSQELRRPLKDLRKAVYYSLRGKVLRKSQNNRTYYSPYHRPGTDVRLAAYKQPERGQVAITILGDRRPYRVAVVYTIDKLNGGEYIFNRYDKGLAQQYLEKVENYLASRPEERDIIDDFRPY